MAPPDATLRLDHAVIAVGDLHVAAQRYRRLGFTVTPGGRHAGSPTHNALILLRDGTYLELLATTRPLLPPLQRALRQPPLRDTLLARWPPLARRFLRGLATGPGPVDFALRTERLDAVVAAARSRGLELEGPYAMGRTRPDGVRLEWRLALPRAPELPFLIEDVTPRELRVPGAGTVHDLAVVGIMGIVVRTADVRAAASLYARLLGMEAEWRELPEGRAASFALGGAWIHLIAAAREGGAPLAVALAGGGGASRPPCVSPAAAPTMRLHSQAHFPRAVHLL